MSESTIPSRPHIDLIVFDFDGVLTDNRVYVFEDGREAVCCNRSDGLGCELLRAAGFDLLILSTEVNPVVSARGRKIGVTVRQGERDKGAALSALMVERRLDPARVMYVGNDVNDLAAMKLVGWPTAPADAHASVREIARLVTNARGGDGVVRELADCLTAQGGNRNDVSS